LEKKGRARKTEGEQKRGDEGTGEGEVRGERE